MAEVKRKPQMQFTPTAELRQVIEAEAAHMGLAVSAFLRAKLLDLFREQIEQIKQQQSNDGSQA
jgi:hypothetical protein